MGIDHTLGLPGGARGIVQRQRVPFVVRQGIGETWIAFGRKILIGRRADPIATEALRVFDIDDEEVRPDCVAAAAAMAENSVSTSRTFASPCPRIYASVPASSRMLLAFRTAPIIGVASAHSSASGMLGAISATVFPFAIPCCAKAEANRLQHSATSPQFRLMVPCICAGSSGCTRSTRLRIETGDRAAWLATQRCGSGPA